ncbi:hypothetical protein VKT23_006143 [Stygiomarasmius scandens]|uniref:Uncharacterized protein n=1 Tax=Marasmiellus scandens TaxID=2682957 RepID=A0ABR1JQR5_9AGAR
MALKLPNYLSWSKVFFLIILTWGLVLQVNYPFADFPISDSLRESLKWQTRYFTSYAGITGIIYLMLIIFVSSLLLSVRAILLVVMRFNKKFKARVEECRAARRARLETLEASGKKRRSKRSVIIEVIVNCVVSVACLLNDAVFNRPQGTAIVEGAWARVSRNALLCAIVVPIEMLIFALFFMIAVLIKVRKARRGQIRLQGDDELNAGLPRDEMTQVPSLKDGFEEKLIEFDEGVEKFEEKMTKEERSEANQL